VGEVVALDAAREALSVSQVLAAVRESLDRSGPGRCWVTGTLSGWRRSRSYAWGELVEHDQLGREVLARLPIQATLAAATRAEKILAAAGVTLADGLELRLCGELVVDARYGPLRLRFDEVDSRTSVGAAALARDALVQALVRSGEAEANKVRQLAQCPARVGLVAPSSGPAGRADFLERLETEAPEMVVHQRLVSMQGHDAAAAVARAIRELGLAGLDAVVLCRGGGPASELATFDDPAVVHAIVGCRAPVIVAVGHSTDHTVADRVAHTSVATPTAAAAFLIDRCRGAQTAASAAAAARAVKDSTQLAERLRAQTLTATAAQARSERKARVLTWAAAVAVVALVILILALVVR
jgi:exodeoxyribonuclease VII large subunit